MKQVVFSVLIAIALMSDGDAKPEAHPVEIDEDPDLVQDSTGDGLAENEAASGPGVSTVVVVADADLLRTLKALEWSVPERPDHKDLSPSISIIRRDTKRCMVGRVYRPCWGI